ncbi:unnamed protein product [Parnassius mnemosyne]|uniref:tRNA-splicing endonuclease subunit Sen54 N-terminal domain-containing protein n=1 Tax=Parnassius mnemosyne TaxID=213953 RepID=A0AAV1LN24_9NEOP
MNKSRILSGYELVEKGITKNQATLPELGLKNVSPTGSWLEQKQIQSAIESRKHLIDAERIEKSGVLSHAVWRESLMLAEVTQKSGGHWQFMGHNVGKKLFLFPEEALFLMEVNCLLLKHNDVKVSLQQAYSLLLKDRKSFIQYKVYASLSRLGYKVFRHTDRKAKSDNINQSKKNYNAENNNSKDTLLDISTSSDAGQCKNNENNDAEAQINKTMKTNGVKDCDMEIVTCDSKPSDFLTCGDNSKNKATNEVNRETKNTEVVKEPNSDLQNSSKESNTTLTYKQFEDKKNVASIYQNQILKLKKRLLKSCNPKKIHNCFKCLPDLLNKHTVSIKVPEKSCVPKNINFIKNIYTLNLEQLKTKCLRPPSMESQAYSISDEVNGAHIRRVRNISDSSRFNNSSVFQSPNFSRFTVNNIQFRPFHFWRPRANLNFFQFSMLYHRPPVPNMFFTPRYPFYRPNCFSQSYAFHGQRYNVRNFRKRTRDNAKNYHLESLKRLAARLKNLIQAGNRQPQNMEALERLIQTYNTRYKSRVRLSSDYEIIEDENILETIELDDDEETRSKKPRVDESYDTYTENFNKIKQLANQLKDFERDNNATARHRRAFSNLVKTFNKSYNADIYINSNYDIIDRRYITLDDSSSDSDCVINECVDTSSGKKLRNPFNILKRLSEKHNKSIDDPSTSSESVDNISDNSIAVKDNKYSEKTLKCFGRNWLPDVNDFGRAEIVSGKILNNECTENFIYEFVKMHPYDYENWVDLKISFLSSLEETTAAFENEAEMDKNESKSIIKPEDCTDMVTVLKKLSIIKANKDKMFEASLVINFDVYNRDVQNFRKTNPPIPHFRIVCIEESSSFPSGDEVATLHAKYNDSVCIVFAIVGLGSISYLQINNTELPMYVSSSNIT